MPTFSARSLKLAVLAVAVMAAGGCDRQSPAAPQPESTTAAAEQAASDGAETFNGTLNIENRGSLMPDFALSDPSGKTLRSADLRGKPVLINLWATWCGPCVLEMPMLDKLAEEDSGKLRVITVSQDIQGAEKVTPFFAARKFAHLEPWMDPDNALSMHYGTGILPTTVLYDAKGREVWRMIGGHDWSGPRTSAMLAETLAGS